MFETPLDFSLILDDEDKISIELIIKYRSCYIRQDAVFILTNINITVREVVYLYVIISCCQKEVDTTKDTIGKAVVRNIRSVNNWYIQFCKDNNFSSCTIKSSSKDNMPPFLLDNLVIAKKLK